MTSNSHPTAMTAPDLSSATAAIVPVRNHGAERLRFPDIPRLELDQLLEQLRDRAEDVLTTQSRLRGLLRANAAVAADLSLPVLLRHIVDAARDLLHAGYAAIVVLGRDAHIQQFVHTGMDDDLVAQIRRLPPGQGVVQLLTAGGEKDVTPPAGSPRSAPGHPPAGGFLGVPIRVSNEVFGTLYLGASRSGAFSAEDEQLVTALAATAGVAIANARLLAESEQRRRWLSASGQLTNQLLAADIEQPLMCVTQAAMTAADADFATLTVPHGDDEVMVAAATGDAATGLLGRTAAGNGSSAGRTIRTGTPVLLTDHGVDPQTHRADDTTTGQVMIVPLAAGTHTHGAVTIGRDADRDRYTDADLDMAMSFGTHAAVALALAEARDTQISDARLEDRDRIAFDMHDHVVGELFALGMGLQGLAATTDNPAHVERINSYIDTLDRVIGTIRTTIFQLQPHRHDPAGLQTRILGIAEAHTEQLGYRPHLHFAGPLDRVVDEPLAADILAVTREALSNCARHAAASTVTVSVVLDHDQLTLEITDNGHGIGTPTRSSGLSNMRRRAEKHSGALTITEPGGGGTRLTWSAICTPLVRPTRAASAPQGEGPQTHPPDLG
jgi:signal transduction histidine kinase